MNKNYYKNFAHAYSALGDSLLETGETHAPRGVETKELRDVQYTITDSYSNLYENSERSVPKKYLANELLWYFSGSNNVRFISRNAKLWNRIKNPDGETVNSAYGHLLFNDPNEYGITEWNWAKQSLADDLDTRQALIRFNKPNHSWFGNRDFVCTLTGIFLVRDNKLHLSINQRSCDIMTGLTFDVPFFMLLMQLMILELKHEHDIDVEMGTFTHTIHSLHVYSKDYDKLNRMLETGFFEDKLPIMESPYIREILDNLISHQGIIKFNDYKDREQSMTADPLIEWCLNKSGWENI
jgi:thymidylate synthase